MSGGAKVRKYLHLLQAITAISITILIGVIITSRLVEKIDTEEEVVVLEEEKVACFVFAEQAVDCDEYFIQLTDKEKQRLIDPRAIHSLNNLNERYKLKKESIERMLEEAGCHADLIYLIAHESHLVSSARSGAGAVGYGQIMPGTARDLGLRVDSEIDERLIPEKAIPATCRYFLELKKRFDGDVLIALAAYNGGFGRIERALNGYTKNFYDLLKKGDIPEETKMFVPSIIAKKMMFEELWARSNIATE